MDNKVSSRYEHIKAKASTMREQRLRLAAAYPNPKFRMEFQRLRSFCLLLVGAKLLGRLQHGMAFVDDDSFQLLVQHLRVNEIRKRL